MSHFAMFAVKKTFSHLLLGLLFMERERKKGTMENYHKASFGIHTAREEKRNSAIPCVLIIASSPQANNLLDTQGFPKIHLLSFLQS